MDLHLKNLFGRFQDQFGSGPGLGPGSGVCLMKVEGISSNIIQSIFSASASLYRSEPWKRLRPGHLFGVRVGKDSDWPGKRQPFQCVQFIGGNGGDIAIYMYRSMSHALKMTDGSWEMARIPNVEVFRVTYELESLLFPSNKRVVKSLSLEVSGTDRFPVIDVARCMTSGELQFRNPTFEELRLVFAVMKAISLVHPLLLQEEKQVRESMVKFLPFIETVDVQWPPEMSKGHDFVAVTVSHPPGQSYEQNFKKTEVMAREDDELDIVSGMTNLRVGYGGEAGLRRCTMCEKAVHRDESICCSHCRATIYCGSDCEKRHWREMHQSVCSLYEAMMSREEELKMKIFTFSCYAENPCEWLGSLGIHKKGMWRRQCGCYSHRPFGLLHLLPSDAQAELWGGLEDGDYPQDLPIQDLNNGGTPGLILLSNWSGYYDLRRLSPSSPVSDILSYPLTLYHILTTPSTHSQNLLLKGKEVTVHYLGPERELDWYKAFAEISHLLNGLGIVQIIMVGPEVPSDTTATTSATNTSRVKVSFVKGLYQDEVTYLTSPDIVVALNCDLDGYSSWAGAAVVVNNMRIPGFFTEKTEEACKNAKVVLRNAGLNISHPVAPNPFRSPVRTCAKSTNLPCYSNGFIFGVNT